METTGPPGWPGDDAARDGAPLDVRAGGADPRLIAAERVIGQLRALIGALVVDAAEDGTPVVVTAEQLADPRLRRLQVRAGRDAVALRLAPAPEAADAATSGDGTGEGAAAGAAGGDADTAEVRSTAAADQSGAARAGVQRAGDSAWMRRLERVAQAHQSHRDSPDHATDDDRDDDSAGNSASDPDDAAPTRPHR